jgi:proteasome assembly chaperone (PAC2) family protein
MEVTNLMTGLRGVTYIKVGILTAEALVLTRQHLQAFHVKGWPPQVSVARDNTVQPSHSSLCAETTPK